MTRAFTIELSDVRADELERHADVLGVDPEVLIRNAVTESINNAENVLAGTRLEEGEP